MPVVTKEDLWCALEQHLPGTEEMEPETYTDLTAMWANNPAVIAAGNPAVPSQAQLDIDCDAYRDGEKKANAKEQARGLIDVDFDASFDVWWNGLTAAEKDNPPTAALKTEYLNADAAASGGGGGGAAYPWALIQDHKGPNVDGGVFTAGAWRTRTLNTIVSDDTSMVTLAGDFKSVSLAAGTYRFQASAPGVECGSHVARIWDSTGSQEIMGRVMSIARSYTTVSEVDGQLVLPVTSSISLQHYCESSSPDAKGMGYAMVSLNNVYASLQIWKVA